MVAEYTTIMPKHTFKNILMVNLVKSIMDVKLGQFYTK